MQSFLFERHTPPAPSTSLVEYISDIDGARGPRLDDNTYHLMSIEINGHQIILSYLLKAFAGRDVDSESFPSSLGSC
jgi:hypothetical protein